MTLSRKASNDTSRHVRITCGFPLGKQGRLRREGEKRLGMTAGIKPTACKPLEEKGEPESGTERGPSRHFENLKLAVRKRGGFGRVEQ